MHINKAVKKQKNSYKCFLSFMVFMSVLLPFVVFFTGELSTPILIYLTVLEFFIIICIVVAIEKMYLKYKCKNNELIFRAGIFAKKNKIFCDKVFIVHTENKKDGMDIILIYTVKRRFGTNKNVSKNLLNRYPEISAQYNVLKKSYDNDVYFYKSIRRGGLNKYYLLDNIYKNCVKAIYTNEAIDNIKIARGQKEILF